MKKLILISLLFINLNLLFANETKIDSLENRLEILSRTEKVDTLILLGQLYIAKSPEKAMAYCEEASDLAISLNYKHGEAMAAFYFGKFSRKLDKFDQALKHQQTAFKIFQDLNNDTLSVQSIIELGLTYFIKPDIDQAINHFNQALELYTQYNDSTGISIAYYNLGRCNRRAGNLDLALDNALNSSRFKEKNNHNALNTISIIYAIMGNLDKAFEYQNKALNIREKLGLQEEVIGSLNNLGLISLRNNKLEQGLEYLLKSAKIAEDIGKKSQLNRTLNNIGFLYDEHFNEPEKALQFFQRSLKISEEIKESFETANTLINIGTLQSKLKKYDFALLNLEKGLTLAKDIKAKELIQNGYVSLSQHYERIGDYRQTYKHYKSFIAAKDSIFSAESSERIAEMQTKYETEKNEKENEIYKLQIEKHRLAQTRLYFGLVFFLILVFIVYYRYLLKIKTNKILKKEIIKRKYIEKGLEVRVKERTKDLSKTNKNLQIEITKRKLVENELKKHRDHLEEMVKEGRADLEEKNKELVHYNRLFENREFRIKELKDKVKALEEKNK